MGDLPQSPPTSTAQQQVNLPAPRLPSGQRAEYALYANERWYWLARALNNRVEQRQVWVLHVEGLDRPFIIGDRAKAIAALLSFAALEDDEKKGA